MLPAFLLVSAMALWQTERDAIGRLDPLDREGIHHAIVTGRLLSAESEPAGNVAVSVICSEYDRSYLLAEGRTDVEGRFRVTDVSARDELTLVVSADDRHRLLTLPIEAASGQVTDLRTLRVERAVAAARVREPLPDVREGVFSVSEASLTVRARGAPIAGAWIDVEILRRGGMPERDRRVRGATYVTDAQGTARRDVNPDEPCEAFVYAPGCAPRRVMWQSDLAIDLAPFDAHARFAPLAQGEHLRVKPAGSPGALAVLYPEGDGAAEGDLVAGAYDAVVVGPSGAALRMVSFAIARGDRALIALDRDDRPVVTLPAPREPLSAGNHWTVTVQRDRGGMPWPEAAGEAQIDRSDPAVFTIRLSGTGTFAIGTSYANVPWRRVTVRAGDRVVIEAPAASATLAISAKRMATAGIVLRSDEVDGWNPMIGILDYHASVATVAELPPGRFHLFRTFAAGHWSKARSFSGAPLVLESGKTTSIPAYEDEKREPIEVVLQESDGTPVQNATLFVEDPMEYPVREQTIVCNIGGDLVGPPLAPRLRVVNGLVTLPAMSAGQLLLRLVRDEGCVFTCARDVVPGTTLTIALPAPR